MEVYEMKLKAMVYEGDINRGLNTKYFNQKIKLATKKHLVKREFDNLTECKEWCKKTICGLNLAKQKPHFAKCEKLQIVDGDIVSVIFFLRGL